MRPAARTGRLIFGYSVFETDQRARFAHRQPVFRRNVLHNRQREAEMVAQSRLGFQLVDGHADGHAHAEQVSGDTLFIKILIIIIVIR